MDCHGCRENVVTALAAFGLGRKDIVPNFKFFCNVPVIDEARLADSVFMESRSEPGDYVELRAEMDAPRSFPIARRSTAPVTRANPVRFG